MRNYQAQKTGVDNTNRRRLITQIRALIILYGKENLIIVSLFKPGLSAKSSSIVSWALGSFETTFAFNLKDVVLSVLHVHTSALPPIVFTNNVTNLTAWVLYFLYSCKAWGQLFKSGLT